MAAPRGWQDEILDRMESGVVVTQIDAALRLSPTERLERMRRALESLERAQRGDGDRLREPARGPRRP